MHSETQSIRDAYKFPIEKDQPQSICSPHAPVKKKKSTRFIPENKQNIALPSSKDRFYFKVKVSKHVSTFLSNLKQSITLRTPNLKEREMQYLQNKEESIKPSQLISQSNVGVLIIQIFLIILFCIGLWKNTYELVFEKLITNHSIEITTILVYLCHIGFFLNTELKNQKFDEIVARKEILSYYLKNKLPYEIIIFLVLILQVFDIVDSNKWSFSILRLCSVTMLVEFYEIYNRIEQIITIPSGLQFSLLISKLLFKIAIFLHVLTLFLNSVRLIQIHFGQHNTWVEKNEIEFSSEFDLYLVGWYWGSTILSTVGFGDITPANNIQRGLVSFIEVGCALIFGFFVNYIGSLIKVKSQYTQSFEKEIRKLNKYLANLSVPEKLKSDVRSHFFHKREIQKNQNLNEEQELLQNLSEHLKHQVLESNHMNVLKNTTLINTFKPQTIKQMAILLKKVVYIPEQVICSKDSEPLKLWVVQKGTIQDKWVSFKSKEQKTISVFNESLHQNVIGWINFLTDAFYKVSSKAKSFCILYELDKFQFMKMLKNNKRDFNKFMELKQLMMSKKIKYNNRCISCDRFTHNVINCPRIHFKAKQINLILSKEQKEKENIFKNQQLRKCKKTRRNQRFKWKIDKRVLTQNQQDDNQSHSTQQILANQSFFIKKDSKDPQLLCQFSKYKEIQDYKRCSVEIQSKNQVKKTISQPDKSIVTNKSIKTVHQIQISQTELNNNLVLMVEKVYFNEDDDYFPEFNIEKLSKQLTAKSEQKIQHILTSKNLRRRKHETMKQQQ